MREFENRKKAYLLLEDGTVYEGYRFGAEGTAFGEICFHTSVVGYQELLTDPAVFGQLIVQTFPLVGNYGVNSEDWESEKVWASGYIVREWCEQPSNFRCEGELQSLLKEQGTVGIYGVDTRALTRKIREKGTMRGAITTEELSGGQEELLQKIKAFRLENAVKETSCKEERRFSGERAEKQVVVYDFGCRKSMVQALLDHGCSVTLVPASTPAEEVIQKHPDGIFLSSGGGDPADCKEILPEIKKLTQSGIPLMGIGLGHQLLALAAGASTEKMLHGHRGSNQPVTCLSTGKTFITQQNHGYMVDFSQVGEKMGRVTHYNANDRSCEGIFYPSIPAFSLQFYPDTEEGSLVTENFYQDFVKLMESGPQALSASFGKAAQE